MGWKIEFYSTKVENEIIDWPKHLRAKFLRIAELVEKIGPDEVKKNE